jgi:hypothetical protein
VQMASLLVPNHPEPRESFTRGKCDDNVECHSHVATAHSVDVLLIAYVCTSFCIYVLYISTTSTLVRQLSNNKIMHVPQKSVFSKCKRFSKEGGITNAIRRVFS